MKRDNYQRNVNEKHEKGAYSNHNNHRGMKFGLFLNFFFDESIFFFIYLYSQIELIIFIIIVFS